MRQWTFTIEVLLRMAVVYLVLLVAMRLMGKRMASQATRNELAALVALAGGVGPSIQDPKNGLLPAVIAAAVVVGGQRLVSLLTLDHGRFERLTQGARTVLVRNGVIDMGALRKIALSRERLLAQLRSSGIVNLGAVNRVYLEIDGAFTIVKEASAAPGLSLLPAFDVELRREQRKAEETCVCAVCGRTLEEPTRCACGSPHREVAIAP